MIGKVVKGREIGIKMTKRTIKKGKRLKRGSRIVWTNLLKNRNKVFRKTNRQGNSEKEMKRMRGRSNKEKL